MKYALSFFALFCALFAFAAPVRVVSLSPAVTETVFSLGAESCLVGRSSACDRPAEAKKLAIAGDFGIADTEKILQLHPDLVIVHHLVNANAERVLKRNGIKLLQLSCNTVKDYCAMVQKLGETLDRQAAAEKEIARINTKRAGWEKLPPLSQKILFAVWGKPLIVAGNGTFCQELVTLAGAKNVDFQGKKGYFSPDAEFLLQNEPDVIVCLFPETALTHHPVLGKMRAVKEKKVIFPHDADAFQRPSPRWCLAVDALRMMLEEKK